MRGLHRRRHFTVWSRNAQGFMHLGQAHVPQHSGLDQANGTHAASQTCYVAQLSRAPRNPSRWLSAALARRPPRRPPAACQERGAHRGSVQRHVVAGQRRLPVPIRGLHPDAQGKGAAMGRGGVSYIQNPLGRCGGGGLARVKQRRGAAGKGRASGSCRGGRSWGSWRHGGGGGRREFSSRPPCHNRVQPGLLPLLRAFPGRVGPTCGQ